MSVGQCRFRVTMMVAPPLGFTPSLTFTTKPDGTVGYEKPDGPLAVVPFEKVKVRCLLDADHAPHEHLVIHPEQKKPHVVHG